jgi:riboflavin kinase/FMN adenylyltransferase
VQVIRIDEQPHDTGRGPCVMALGTFDGVHIGHQEIIRKTTDIAREQSLPSAVFLSDPHPRQVLGMGQQYRLQLTPLPEKLRVLEGLGIEIAFVLHFTKKIAAVPPEMFLPRFLLPLNPVCLVAGFDYTFGSGGKGNAILLKDQASRYGIEVHILSPVNRYGEKVSSTLLREKLQAGEMKEATELLGRPYAAQGVVVHGEGRGKSIGFPTANVDIDKGYILPRTGVYVVRVTFPGFRGYGVMNIGYKPTFHDRDAEKTAEVHLFDFDGNLYHQTVRIEWLDFLREERKFSSVDELVRQIRRDVEEAKRRIENFREGENVVI